MTGRTHAWLATGVRKLRLVVPTLAIGAALLWSTRGQAFSDPERFHESSELGGGGGRLFTGSPRDGFSCGVCHSGAAAPEVMFDGLPEVYEPGQYYEVRVHWLRPELSHAMQFELHTPRGVHPSVRLPNAGNLPAHSRCDGALHGVPAVYQADIDSRRILGVQDCGASEMLFGFIAPDEPHVYFAAGVVRSNGSGTPDGDGVLELRRRLVRQGDDEPEAGCRIAASPSPGTTAFVCIAWLGLFRRRLRKRDPDGARDLEHVHPVQAHKREIPQP